MIVYLSSYGFAASCQLVCHSEEACKADVVTEGNPFRGNLNKNIWIFDEIATVAVAPSQ